MTDFITTDIIVFLITVPHLTSMKKRKSAVDAQTIKTIAI